MKVVDFFSGTALRVPIFMYHIALLGVYQVTHHVLILWIEFFVLFLRTRLHICKLMTIFLGRLCVIEEPTTLCHAKPRLWLG